MINKLGNIAKLQLVKDSLKLSSGNVLMYLIPMVVTPILSRLYTRNNLANGVYFQVLSQLLRLYYWVALNTRLLNVKKTRCMLFKNYAHSPQCACCQCVLSHLR